MLAIIIIALFITLLLLWSIYLPFYKEKTVVLESDESKCFSPRCKSVVYKNDNKKAVLFIHGFPSTPYMYDYATKYMRDKGYDVYAPLIPTFGADIKEFERTNFSSWFLFIDNYYKKLRTQYDTLDVIGVSMGGAMTLKLAEVHSSDGLKPNAIAVVAAPVTLNSFFRDGIVTNKGVYFVRIIRPFFASYKAYIGTELKDHNDGDETWTGYHGFFSTPTLSLSWNLKIIRRELGRINVPMISFHDEGDRTVPFKNQVIIERETHTKSIFIKQKMDDKYIHTHHALLSYHSCQEELMDKIYTFLEENNG